MKETVVKHLALCSKCASFKNGKCTDCFEPGIIYVCINFIEDKEDDNKQRNV